MRVLLTGSTGFLGKYVVKELESRGHEVVEYNRKEYGSLTNMYGLSDIFIDDHLENLPIDAVIHLAAKVGGIYANSQAPFDFINQNLLMGLNVINSAIQNKIEKFVMVSTVCAYPDNTPLPFKEENIWNGYPESTNAPYGIAKRTLTEVLWAASKQFSFNSTTLNLANLYGPNDNEDPQNSHVIPALVNKVREAALQNVLFPSQKNSVELWGDEETTRDFLHVRDAARAIVDALATPQGPQFGINIGTGVETSILNLAIELCFIFNLPVSRLNCNGKLSGQKRRKLDCTLARELLGWQPSTSLLEGLLELCSLKGR